LVYNRITISWFNTKMKPRIVTEVSDAIETEISYAKAWNKVAEQKEHILGLESLVNKLRNKDAKGEQEFHKLEAEVERLTKREEQHSLLLEEKFKLEEELDGAKFEIAEVKRKYDILVDRNNVLEEKHYDLQINRDRLERECSERKIAITKNLSELQGVVMKNQLLSTSSRKLEKEIELSKARVKLLEQEVSILQPQLERNHLCHRESELNLRIELDEMQAELLKATATATSNAQLLARKTSAMTLQEDQQKSSLQEWTRKVNDLQSELCQTKYELESTKKRVKWQEQRLCEMEHECKIIDEESQAKKIELENRIEEVEQLKKITTEQESQIETLQKELKDAKEDSMEENLKVSFDYDDNSQSDFLTETENPRVDHWKRGELKIETTRLFHKYKAVLAQKIELERNNARLSSKNFMLERHMQDQAPVEQRYKNDRAKVKRDFEILQEKFNEARKKELKLESENKEKDKRQQQMERDMGAIVQINKHLESMLMNRAERLSENSGDPFWSQYTNIRELVSKSSQALTKLAMVEAQKKSHEVNLKESTEKIQSELEQLKAKHKNSILEKQKTDEQLAEILNQHKPEEKSRLSSFPTDSEMRVDENDHELQAQLSNTQQKLKNCESEKKKLKNEIGNLNSRLSQLSYQLESTNIEKSKTGSLLQSCQQELIRLKENLKYQVEESVKAEQRSQNLIGKKREQEGLVHKLRLANEDLQQKLHNIQFRLKLLENQIENQKKTINAKSDETELTDDLKELLEKKNTNLDQALTQLEMIVKDRHAVQWELAQAKADIRRQEQTILDLESQERRAKLIAKSQSENQSLVYRQTLSKLVTNEISLVKKCILESPTKVSQNVFDDLRGLGNIMDDEKYEVVSKWKQQAESASQELKNMKAVLKETRIMVDVRDKESERLKLELTTKNNQFQIAVKESIKSNSKVKALTKSLQDMENKLSTEQSAFEEGKAVILGHEAEIAKLRASNKTLKAQTTKSEAKSKEMQSRWENELRLHRDHIDEVRTLKQENEILRKELISAKQQKDESSLFFQEQLDESKAQQKSLKEKLTDLKLQISTKKEEWANLHKAFKYLQDQHKELLKERDRKFKLLFSQTGVVPTIASNPKVEILEKTNEGLATALRNEFKRKAEMESFLKKRDHEIIRLNEKLASVTRELENHKLMFEKQFKSQKLQECTMQNYTELLQKVKRLNAIESLNADLSQRCKELEKNLENEKTRQKVLQTKAEKCENLISKMNKERNDIIVKLENAQEQIEFFVARNKALVKKYSHVDPVKYKKMQARKKSLEAKIEDIFKANQHVLRAKNTAIKRIKDQKQSQNKIIKGLEKRLAGLHAELNSKAALEKGSLPPTETNNDISQVTSSNISHEIEALRAALQKAQSQMREEESKKGSHMDVLVKRNNELIEVASQARHIITKLEKEIELLRDDVKSPNHSSNNQDIQQLTVTLENWRKQAVQAKSLNKRLTGENGQLKKQVHVKSERIESLMEDSRNAEETGAAVRLQLEGAQKGVQSERLRGKSLQQRVKNLEKKLALANREKDTLRRDSEERFSELQLEHQELAEKYEGAQALIAELNQQTEDIEQQEAERQKREEITEEQIEDVGEETEGSESGHHATHKRTIQEAFSGDESPDIELKVPLTKRARNVSNDVAMDEQDEANLSTPEQEHDSDKIELQEETEALVEGSQGNPEIGLLHGIGEGSLEAELPAAVPSSSLPPDDLLADSSPHAEEEQEDIIEANEATQDDESVIETSTEKEKLIVGLGFELPGKTSESPSLDTLSALEPPESGTGIPIKPQTTETVLETIEEGDEDREETISEESEEVLDKGEQSDSSEANVEEKVSSETIEPGVPSEEDLHEIELI